MSDEIALKEYTIVAEFVSEHPDDFSRRFLNIIQAAQNRAGKAEGFFGRAAVQAADCFGRSFFLQLGAAKALHRRIIEKIRRRSGLEIDSSEARDIEEPGPEISSADWPVERAAQSAMQAEDAFELVYEKTMDELDFYLNFLFIETHPIISSLLLSLAGLSKDFLFEAKLRFLEYQSRIETGDPGKVVEHILNLEHRCN